MELTDEDLQLQGLIDRAGQLQERIGVEIAAGSLSYCKLCSDHGKYCNVPGANTFYEDRERLVEIRDSLKDLETMLAYMQSLRSWQLVNRNAMLARLEESRSNLIKKANLYQGSAQDVIQELNECFGRGGIGFKSRALNDEMKKAGESTTARTKKKRLFGLLISCIGSLFNPWKWHRTARTAVRMALVLASVSSTVSLMHGGWNQNSVSRRRAHASAQPGRELFKDKNLDVFYGRG